MEQVERDGNVSRGSYLKRKGTNGKSDIKLE